MTMNSIRRESETAFDETLSFKEATRVRRSIRGFLDKPVPDSLIREVLEDAQYAPSNCNTQPWNTHVVRGEKLRQLSLATTSVVRCRVVEAFSDAGLPLSEPDL